MKNKNLFIKVMLGLLVICSTTFILIQSSSGADVNLMGVVLIGFPIFTFITSLIMQLLIKKKVIILSTVFIGYLIATFVLYNSSFLIWCFVYTGTSLIATLIADFILKCKKKFTT